MVAALSSARVGWIVAAVLLLPLNLLLESVGWHQLVRPIAPTTRWRTALASLLAGHTLGFVSPAGVGAYVGRAYVLPDPRRGVLMALTFTDQLLAMLVALSAGLFGYTTYLNLATPTPILLWQSGFFLGSTLVLCLLGLLLYPRAAYGVLHRFLCTPRFRQRLRFLQRYTTSAMLRLLGLAALRYVMYVSQFVLLLLAFLPELSIWSAYLGVSAVFFAKYLIPPVTLMDLGIRESAAVFFLAAFGVSPAVAFDAAFLLFCINLLGPALLGVPFVFSLQIGRGQALKEAVPPLAS
jgi:uncharacterized membrane protein YbhN (UPF0104 family)